MTIGERMKTLADKQGITTKHLATEAGVTQRAITYYYTSQRRPNIIIGYKIAKTLNTTVEYLVEGDI